MEEQEYTPTEVWGPHSLYRRLRAEDERTEPSKKLYVPSFTFVDHGDGTFGFQSTDSRSVFTGWRGHTRWATWKAFTNDYWNGTSGVATNDDRLAVLDQFSAICEPWVFSK